jgi:DNA-binding NtrC family response regulator
MNSSVLVVDAEENLLLLLDRVLSQEGYQVKTAIDANEALEFLDENDIAVALIDITMHPIGDIDLLVEIKKRSPAPHRKLKAGAFNMVQPTNLRNLWNFLCSSDLMNMQ